MLGYCPQCGNSGGTVDAHGEQFHPDCLDAFDREYQDYRDAEFADRPKRKQGRIWAFPQWSETDGRTITRTASEADLEFIVSCAEQHRTSQGFVPLKTYPNWIRAGQIMVTFDECSRERLGYVAITGGVYRPVIVRHNTIVLHERGRGLGLLQMERIKRWAEDQTAFDVMRIRTRSDLYRQLKINEKIGGKVQCVTRNKTTAKGKTIMIWEVPLGLPWFMCSTSTNRCTTQSITSVRRPDFIAGLPSTKKEGGQG